MTERKIRNDHSVVLDSYTGVTRDDFIKLMDEALAELTGDEQSTATFEIEKWEEYDSCYAELRLNYTRPETDEEFEERTNADARLEAMRRDRELKLLEDLKKKYPQS